MRTAGRALGAAGVSAWDVLALAYGLRFVVHDMGNGVRRVSSAQILPIADAKVEADLPGRTKVAFPPPAWLVDAGFSAIEGLGITVDRGMRASTPMVYARDIDDFTMELICWRA